MKKLLVILPLLLAGCGWSSWDNDGIGQVKKVAHYTPIICPAYDAVDVSLGVIRNGIGSVSSQDMWFYVADTQALATLRSASESGAIVKFHYGVKRWRWCVNEEMITDVEVVK